MTARIDRKDLEGISVLLTMPIRDGVSWPTMQSLLETQTLMLNSGVPFEMRASVDGVTVNVGRSLGAHQALQTAHNRIFMIDSDMQWKASDFLRFVALSTKMDIVAGSYCNRRDPPEFFINAEAGDVEANEWGCLPFKGLGLGFTCVNRKVLEELAADAVKLRFPNHKEPIAHIFTDDVIDGEYQGEDMAFFARAKRKGHQLWVDPSIVLGHVGQKIFTASLLDHIEHVADAA